MGVSRARTSSNRDDSRSTGLEPTCARAYDDAMRATPTPAWFLVRLELLVGVGLTVFVGLVASSNPFVIVGRGNPTTLGPIATLASIIIVFVPIIGLVIAVVGLTWMVRIFRGPIDEPPHWRYRDL